LKAPIEVAFQVKVFSASGITVRYLKIAEKSGYEGFPWLSFCICNIFGLGLDMSLVMEIIKLECLIFEI